MNKVQATEQFIEIMGAARIRDAIDHDKPLVRTAWNDFVDGLRKDQQITEKQASTWVNPFPRVR